MKIGLHIEAWPWFFIQLSAIITWYNDIAYITTVTEAKYKWKFEHTKDLPIIFCENFEENWPRHNGMALYVGIISDARGVYHYMSNDFIGASEVFMVI